MLNTENAGLVGFSGAVVPSAVVVSFAPEVAGATFAVGVPGSGLALSGA